MPLLIALGTGFVSVGFEVLWTRGLSTRFVSGVYSLSIILFVYLLCIAVGSFLVRVLDRRGWVSPLSCAVLLVAAGLTGMLSTAMLARVPQTNHAFMGEQAVGFWEFELHQLLRSLAVMATSLLMFGLTLPMVVRLATRDVARVGSSVGTIYLVNSVGAVLAPLVVGFWLMPALGLSGAIVALGGLLCGLGAFVVLPWAVTDRRYVLAGLAFIVPCCALCAGIALSPDTRAWKSHPEARLVAYREGVAAAVSVVDHPGRGRIMQVNLGYTLGGSRGIFVQRRQALWPVLTNPNIESILTLGLGTGCTAGTAFAATGARTDALEIIPGVLPMLRYFERENLSLLKRAAEEPDLRVLSVDARHFVRTTPLRYDVVIGDLFEPWRRGVGTMYAREHFTSVKRILSDDGAFWQWLPLYQLAEAEFKTIARTFCDVFEHVDVWWCSFNAEHPTIALVGTRRFQPVNTATVRSIVGTGNPGQIWAEAGFLGSGPVFGSWICGRDTLVAFVGSGPVNTLDRPLVEFNAPRSVSRRRGEMSGANMRSMFELANRAETGRSQKFPERVSREKAQRYRASIEKMMTAHEHQLRGRTIESAELAVEAMANTPEWAYPALFCDGVVTQMLGQGNDRNLDRLLRRVDTAPAVRYWAEYWRGQRSVRDNDPYAAQGHFREALKINPAHTRSARLLRELERRYGRRRTRGD